MLIRSTHSTGSPRRGVVLLAVLLVVVVLTLAAYQYSEWITAERRAADAYSRAAQARALAQSGVHFAAAVLSNPDAMTNTLNDNPWDNAAAFQNVKVGDGGSGPQGVFSIIGLLPPDDPSAASQPYRFGVVDEAGKININALLGLDSGKGDAAHAMLMLLPNMTDDIANSILDWLDPDDTPRSNGAEEEYYGTLTPPYHCKNGPLDSLEELLLVKGVTPQLLFGNDRNRNGVLDADEDDGSAQVDLGWSAYLTVYSREPNTDAKGNARIYINDTDINSLADKLTAVLSQDMANYIIAYRLYGPAAAPPTPPGAPTPPTTQTPPLSDSDSDDVKTQLTTARANTSTQKPQSLKSILDLLGSKVSITTGSGRTMKTITWACPLNDPSVLKTQLPLILDQTTTSQNPDLTPRINVNTASETVLATLPGLDEEEVQMILTSRSDPSSNEAPAPIFQTPAWLLTEANLPVAKVKALEAYITARTQVYRFQALGYFQGGGPTARFEAVVDGNNGRPRIVYLRDLAELGPGFNMNATGP